MELLKLFFGNNPVGAVLAFFIGGMFCLLLVILVLVDLPGKNVDLIREMMIALIAAFAAAYGYFLGSSKGSGDKTDLLTKAPGGEAPTPPK